MLAASTIEENNYLRTASLLQDLLDQQEASLAPETVAAAEGEPAPRSMRPILEARMRCAHPRTNCSSRCSLPATDRKWICCAAQRR